MRDVNTRDLPAESQVMECSEVLTTIGAALTGFRNVMKTKIRASLSPDNQDTRNVADLTDALISNVGLNHTLQLYMRVAVLRWVAESYPQAVEKYWEKVDEVLETWRKDAANQQHLISCFNRVYEQDILKYGKPSDTTYTVHASNSAHAWVQQIDRYATQVSSAPGVRANKRRRTATTATINDAAEGEVAEDMAG
ncbi:hypothetical protein CPC08DRAFT_650501 [Agrocybe pediades]|nr:hypothetical protein CPC08DRAFT_650501 [Agrocybe pediades]